MGSHAHHADLAHASHAHALTQGSERRLAVVLALAAAYMLAEVGGGLWTHPLARRADARHMLADVAALALSLFAAWLARRPPHPGRTYGYLRAEILAALVNGSALGAVGVRVARAAAGGPRGPA